MKIAPVSKLRIVTRSTLCVLSLVVCAGSQARAQLSPGAQSVAACAPEKGGYTCSRTAFHHVWRQARTVQVETPPQDRIARGQVEEFVSNSGKSVAAEGPADLRLVLMPADANEVRMGPAASNLSVLSVYLVGPEGRRGPLVWSETLTGQADMRWPAIVHSALAQFQSEFGKKRH